MHMEKGRLGLAKKGKDRENCRRGIKSILLGIKKELFGFQEARRVAGPG